ncbi:MAG: glycosyl hydrolase family 18 protein [Lachnospiraceae bacterium]|nr:glycosyl hydrolase family 18 protein [Lachnospiraceae bacterium]
MIYVVQPGDTVDLIATRTNVPVETIIYDNQISYPYRLAVGQAVYIAEDIDNNESQDKRFIYVEGYAYPFIREWVLNQALPYLTDLLVFSYGFTEEGDLIPPAADDQWMIERAGQYGVNTVLTLTPIDASGNFNNYLISSVVNREDRIGVMISQLLGTLSHKRFSGVNIDFEYIRAEDREAYTAFVRTVREALNAEGYQVSVALAPKTSDTQQGLLYEGMDYRGLGEAADYVLLMTYEWGYTYGPPMAVAPIDQVRAVVEYAVTQIEPSKINLGIPNYGYDWPLPFVRGTTRARTLGNQQAVQLAITQGVEIRFDESAMSPFFIYAEDGIEHEVWFEDVRSIQAKFDLVKEFQLRGVGYWQLMQPFLANWLLLKDNFRIIYE